MKLLSSQAARPHGIAGIAFSWIMEQINRKTNDAVGDFVSAIHPNSILELGFGPGQLIARLHQRLPNAFMGGVDPSKLMVAQAIKRNRAMTSPTYFDLRLGQADSLPWQDGSMDIIVAVHSFQFWPDPQRVFDQVQRVLRPGAMFLIVLRQRYGRASASVTNPLSREADELTATLRALLQHGFIHVKHEGLFGNSPAISARRAENG